MKIAHNIVFTVFISPEELVSDPERITRFESQLRALIPIDFVKEKLAFKKTDVEGFNGRKIRIITLTIEKGPHVTSTLKALHNVLEPLTRAKILQELDSRIDEESFFYIRFDKDAFCQGIYTLTDTGNCVHLKIAIAAYPKKRDVTLQVAREWLTK